MIILLVSLNDELKSKISIKFKQKGYSIVHYTDPVKAIVNFEEIEPEIVIFNAIDFPRHWKVANVLLKQNENKFQSQFFLLIDKEFPMEEACKALYLGVDAIISDIFHKNNYQRHLQRLISRYHSSQKSIKTPIAFSSPGHRINFMFMNPETFQLTTGKISEISLSGAGFLSDDPKAVFLLEKGMILEACSLRSDEGIITIKAEIISNNGIMDLKFIAFEEDGKELLEKFISKKDLGL